jgi:hypothetical protein
MAGEPEPAPPSERARRTEFLMPPPAARVGLLALAAPGRLPEGGGPASGHRRADPAWKRWTLEAREGELLEPRDGEDPLDGFGLRLLEVVRPAAYMP